MNDISASILVV